MIMLMRSSLVLALAFLLGLTVSPLRGRCESIALEVRLLLPYPTRFRIEASPGSSGNSDAPRAWLSAQQLDGNAQQVEFGDRVVLQVVDPAAMDRLLAGFDLVPSRRIDAHLSILQARDAQTALHAAARLATQPGIVAAYPVIRREATPDSAYAARPNDPHFPADFGGVSGQWYLENRDPSTGASLGPDLNVRAAWPITRGQGVTLAVADVGVELTHPELALRAAGAPHRNFNNDSTNVIPSGIDRIWAHGTSSAALALAEGDNAYGMSGIAPLASLAAWVIYTNRAGSPILLGDDKLMDMFQHASNVVAVQNHSWSPVGLGQQPRTALEEAGIANAIQAGRDGRGVIMIRASGNDRATGANANDSGFCADPRVITVGSVDRSGRAPSYSEPGACVLVAAPSGSPGGSGLFSADLLESRGAMMFGFFPPFEYLWNFVFNSLGFSGTSASAPQVAGMAALVLSANPALTYRDVQQILVLSARHFDLADPGLLLNGAGFLVSHNAGFGVPDAGQAVKIALAWTNRPAATSIAFTSNETLSIPDGGLGLRMTGDDIPSALSFIRGLPALGPHPDDATASLPLVDIGLGLDNTGIDLTGKAALIERGTNDFDDKIIRAAAAGASFAVIYNYLTNSTGGGCPGGDELCALGGTDFVPIPALFITHADGIALKNLFLANPTARAQIRLEGVTRLFNVSDELLCEQVGVRVRTDHPLRGDLRITLVSPAGTRSILQTYGADTNAGPADWTYLSTHHFFEASQGPWRVEIADELQEAAGSVLEVSLQITGTPIRDSDADGLDDDWETARLGELGLGPRDDPDGDGHVNAREQLLGTDPRSVNEPLRLDVALWDPNLARLSWPGTSDRAYEILAGPDPASMLPVATVPGRFPETEWFAPFVNDAGQFFQVRVAP